MMRRIGATLFVSIAWLACVGDDPAPASMPDAAATPDAATGERLAPCFADGKCKEGLVCQPTEKICIAAADPATDGGGDATAIDADATTSEADASVLKCELLPAPKVPCPDTPCGAPNTCCIDTATGARSCDTQCAEGSRSFECDTLKTCGNGTRCCAIVASEKVGAVCEKRVTLSRSYCTLDPCPSSRPACRTGSDCTIAGLSTCRLSEVELATGAITVWGFCTP